MTLGNGRIDLAPGLYAEFIYAAHPDSSAKLEENQWLNIAKVSGKSQGMAFVNGGDMRVAMPLALALMSGWSKNEHDDIYIRRLGTIRKTGVDVFSFAVPSAGDADFITTIGLGAFDYRLVSKSEYTYTLIVVDENSVFWDSHCDDSDGTQDVHAICLKEYDIDDVWDERAGKGLELMAFLLSDGQIQRALVQDESSD